MTTISLLAIENHSRDAFHQLKEVVAFFPAKHWISVKTSKKGCRIIQADNTHSMDINKMNNLPTLQFYEEIFKQMPEGTIILRVQNPNYPLHERIYGEISQHFPSEEFDYVLSSAEECGLCGFSVERFNYTVLRNVYQSKIPLTPAGYFNGLTGAKSGRHFFSLPLRKFYYQDHFETLFDSPRSVAINTIPGCNLQCLKCQYHSPRLVHITPPAPPMGLDKIRQIIEKCSEFKRLTSIAPTISGEPLLHPHIDRVVKMISSAGYSCGFATNATLLTTSMTHKLIDAGVESLAFSVDSPDPKTYKELQGYDLYEVEKNIMYFQETSLRQLGSFNGTMICVVSEQNAHQIEEYRNKWRDRGFSVLFSAEHDIMNTYSPFFKHTQWAPEERMPCWALWHGLYLTNEGRVVTCGSMAKTKGLPVSILSEDPHALWRSHDLQNLRQFQLTGKTPGYCASFSCWTGMMSTWVHDGNRLTLHTQGSWLEPLTPPNSGRRSLHQIIKQYAPHIRRIIKNIF